MKRQLTERGETFVLHTFCRGFRSKICKELKNHNKLTTKTTQSVSTPKKGADRSLKTQHKCLINMKNLSTSGPIKEMQMKATLKFHLTPS